MKIKALIFIVLVLGVDISYAIQVTIDGYDFTVNKENPRAYDLLYELVNNTKYTELRNHIALLLNNTPQSLIYYELYDYTSGLRIGQNQEIFEDHDYEVVLPVDHYWLQANLRSMEQRRD